MKIKKTAAIATVIACITVMSGCSPPKTSGFSKNADVVKSWDNTISKEISYDGKIQIDDKTGYASVISISGLKSKSRSTASVGIADSDNNDVQNRIITLGEKSYLNLTEELRSSLNISNDYDFVEFSGNKNIDDKISRWLSDTMTTAQYTSLSGNPVKASGVFSEDLSSKDVKRLFSLFTDNTVLKLIMITYGDNLQNGIEQAINGSGKYSINVFIKDDMISEVVLKSSNWDSADNGKNLFGKDNKRTDIDGISADIQFERKAVSDKDIILPRKTIAYSEGR
jgi:hypothetical protein